MPIVVEKIKNFKIKIDERRVLRHIGYKRTPDKISKTVKKILKQEKQDLDFLLEPASIYTILNYEETNKHPIFKDAEKVGLCICTIGPKLEKKIKELMGKNELLRALVLDGLGSEAVEWVASETDRIIAEKALKINLWPSKRFSAGYKKWDLSEQKFIFNILPAEEIGVKLKESCMMVPRKSISFRINFYKDKKFTTRKLISSKTRHSLGRKY